MTDVRVLKPPVVPEPTGPSHAATKNYVDVAALPVASRAAANGVAPLDSGLLVPIAHLPATGPTDYPNSVGDFNNPGTSALLSRADHTHNGIPATGISSPVSGDALVYNGTAWTNLNVTTSGPTETQLHGDLLSPIRREQSTNSTTMDNGFYTVSGLVATKTVTVTTMRFYVASAGTAGGAPTFTVGLYTGSGSTVTRQAVVNVTTSSLTSTGLKAIALANSVSITAGQRVYFVSYVAPSSYSAVASLACGATYWGALVNASTTWQGYKSASTAAPTTINVGDGTWSASTNTIWWSVL